MASVLKLQTLNTGASLFGFDDLPFMSSTSAVCSGVSVQCQGGATQFSME
jgi:hypothetical protein